MEKLKKLSEQQREEEVGEQQGESEGGEVQLDEDEIHETTETIMTTMMMMIAMVEDQLVEVREEQRGEGVEELARGVPEVEGEVRMRVERGGLVMVRPHLPIIPNTLTTDDGDIRTCSCGGQAVVRTAGPTSKNAGRSFYTCPKPQGQTCGFFVSSTMPSSGEGKLITRNGQMKNLVETLQLDLVDLDLLVHMVTMTMINPPSELVLL
jgi:hypothetical protein